MSKPKKKQVLEDELDSREEMVLSKALELSLLSPAESSTSSKTKVGRPVTNHSDVSAQRRQKYRADTDARLVERMLRVEAPGEENQQKRRW